MTALVLRTVAAACGLAAVLSSMACDGRLLLTEEHEARHLSASLHVNVARANEAANRAILSDADAASEAAAREAMEAAAAADKDLQQLTPLVKGLGYSDEIRLVEQFTQRFAEYRQLDAEVLPLAVENTNLKAQRLAFGGAQAQADALSLALDRIDEPGSPSLDAATAKVKNGVLEIQVIQSRHIAEADDAVMDRLEQQMTTAEQNSRAGLAALRTLKPSAVDMLATATEALDRFLVLNGEIVQLSRRNTHVRSLAVALGRKRVVAAECESLLQALEQALAAHSFKGTK